MSNDPLRIPLSRLGDLLKGFGLDPVDLDDLRSVNITSGKIEVVRFRSDTGEHRVALPGTDEIATETVTIALVDG